MKRHRKLTRVAMGLMMAGAAIPLSAAAGEETTEALRQSLEEYGRQLETYKQKLAEQEAEVKELRRALTASQRQMDTMLGRMRGAGTAPAAAVPAPAAPAGGEPRQVAQAGQPAREQPVGQPPAEEGPRGVAQIFEQPGVLTPRGKMVLEPGLQFAYSSSSQITLSGFTVIPAILIGVVDVREIKRETWTASLTGRYGITNRLELEARIPWVYRKDSTLARPIVEPSGQDFLFETSSSKLGDVELTGRYQFNDGGADKPYYIGSLKFKTRTGFDTFEANKFSTPLSGGPLLDAEPPTGSGFYSLTPGITFLLPSDPVVLFGGLSYTYNFKRKNVTTFTLNSDQTEILQRIGDVKAGNYLGFNFGLGLALNEKSSISLGYDHTVVGKTRIGGANAPKSQRIQLGTFLVGYSYRLAPHKSLNLSLGIGATRDAPETQLSLRMPFTF